MSLFGKLKSEGLEESTDRVGGFQAKDSDIYNAKIKAAYAGKSPGGAMSVTIIALLPDKSEYRETLYVTNKQGENFFLNKKDTSKKVPLPGFTIVDDICLIVTGKPLAEQDTEEKVIKLWDFDAGKELPKAVDMITALIDGEVSLGILKEEHNKQEKKGDEYVPTEVIIEKNVIDKVWNTEHKMTVVEAKNGADKGAFWDSWLERNLGAVKDRRKLKDGQAGSTSGPPQAGNQSTERKSLFGTSKK